MSYPYETEITLSIKDTDGVKRRKVKHWDFSSLEQNTRSAFALRDERMVLTVPRSLKVLDSEGYGALFAKRTDHNGNQLIALVGSQQGNQVPTMGELPVCDNVDFLVRLVRPGEENCWKASLLSKRKTRVRQWLALPRNGETCILGDTQPVTLFSIAHPVSKLQIGNAFGQREPDLELRADIGDTKMQEVREWMIQNERSISLKLTEDYCLHIACDYKHCQIFWGFVEPIRDPPELGHQQLLFWQRFRPNENHLWTRTMSNPTYELVVEEKKLALALDLDETLFTGGPVDKNGRFPSAVKNAKISRNGKYWMQFRSGLLEFLNKLSEHFVLGICTAADETWMNMFLDLLEEEFQESQYSWKVEDLFPRKHRVALSSGRHPHKKKQFSDVFPHYHRHACFGLDDKSSSMGGSLWCKEDVYHVYPISEYIKQLENRDIDIGGEGDLEVLFDVLKKMKETYYDQFRSLKEPQLDSQTGEMILKPKKDQNGNKMYPKYRTAAEVIHYFQQQKVKDVDNREASPAPSPAPTPPGRSPEPGGGTLFSFPETRSGIEPARRGLFAESLSPQVGPAAGPQSSVSANMNTAAVSLAQHSQGDFGSVRNIGRANQMVEQQAGAAVNPRLNSHNRPPRFPIFMDVNVLYEMSQSEHKLVFNKGGQCWISLVTWCEMDHHNHLEESEKNQKKKEGCSGFRNGRNALESKHPEMKTEYFKLQTIEEEAEVKAKYGGLIGSNLSRNLQNDMLLMFSAKYCERAGVLTNDGANGGGLVELCHTNGVPVRTLSQFRRELPVAKNCYEAFK